MSGGMEDQSGGGVPQQSQLPFPEVWKTLGNPGVGEGHYQELGSG